MTGKHTDPAPAPPPPRSSATGGGAGTENVHEAKNDRPGLNACLKISFSVPFVEAELSLDF